MVARRFALVTLSLLPILMMSYTLRAEFGGPNL